MSALAAFALSLLSLAGTSQTPTAEPQRPRIEVIGRSARGRPIRATAVGEASARRTILVIGCIHGNECAGTAVTRRLARGRAVREAAIWVVHNVNPDGTARGVRQNGRGVDLNRNFPSEWRAIGRRWDPQYSGPHPFSERESRVVRRLVLRLRPETTIWFHQPQALVRAWGGSVRDARRYARLAGVPYRSIRWPAGTAPNWQNHRFPRTTSFVVELPPGPLSAHDAARHARAIRLLAGSLARPRRPRLFPASPTVVAACARAQARAAFPVLCPRRLPRASVGTRPRDRPARTAANVVDDRDGVNGVDISYSAPFEREWWRNGRSRFLHFAVLKGDSAWGRPDEGSERIGPAVIGGNQGTLFLGRAYGYDAHHYLFYWREAGVPYVASLHGSYRRETLALLDALVAQLRPVGARHD